MQPERYDFAELLNGDCTDADTLRAWLLDARRRTRALTDDLEGGHELGPKLAIVNPPLWELGHIAWFQEYWCLRFRNGAAPAASMIERADALYNSAIAAHDTRWDLALLSWSDMRGYQERVLERVLKRLDQGSLSEELAYFALLCVLHEDMHGEALCYTRQSLGHARVDLATERAPRAPAQSQAAAGDVHYSGGRFALGARRGGGFAFDNEAWSHEVELAPFQLARAPVSYGEFATFVDEGGYRHDALWSAEGLAWRAAANAQCPLYWRKQGEQWLVRDHTKWIALGERANRAMMFVNWYEAQAYCRWAQRRLPSEAEREFAADTEEYDSVNFTPSDFQESPIGSIDRTQSSSRIEMACGEAWEWTADWFAPYPGFAPGPYREYSAPWFRDHKVLRGASFVSRTRLLRPTYRNFYTPERRDVFAGFRTAAL